MFLISRYFRIIFVLVVGLFFQTFVLGSEQAGPLEEQIQLLQTKIDQKGGFGIVGKVEFEDGKKINGGTDVQINYHSDGDRPAKINDDGWFYFYVPLERSYTGAGGKVTIRAFGYRPIEDEINLADGKVHQLKYKLTKLPDSDLSAVNGVILDESQNPVDGANVTLFYPFTNHGIGNHPVLTYKTGVDGVYKFEGLEPAKFRFYAEGSNGAFNRRMFTPKRGENILQEMTIFAIRKLTLDYVYQANGTRDFLYGDLRYGRIEWSERQGGLDFSEARIERNDHDTYRDLEMYRDYNKIALVFRVLYVSDSNGFYDAGLVDLSEIIEAKPEGYSSNAAPCILGHTYVVKTYEGHYAKFKVIEINP